MDGWRGDGGDKRVDEEEGVYSGHPVPLGAHLTGVRLTFKEVVVIRQTPIAQCLGISQKKL